MRRREILATVAGTTLAGVAGCIDSVGLGGGQGTCTAPSTDDLESLLPEGDDRFTGQYAVSSGFGGLGTDRYVAGRYRGPNGGTNDLLVANYDSNEAARNNRAAAVAKGEFPATGSFVVGQYVVVVDARSEALGRDLVGASAFGSACAAELSFGGGGSGAPTGTTTGEGTTSETPTRTETETPTRTPTETATADPVVSSFSDDWEDGNYKRDPVWFSETGDSNTFNTDVSIGVADVTSPRGSKALEYDIEWGRAKVTTGKKLRFDAPWTLDTLVRYAGAIGPSKYAIRVGSGGGGFIGGSAADFGVELNVTDEGSEARRRARAKVAGSLIEQSNQIERILRADTWYRIRARHEGDGTYRLRLWNATASEDEAAVATSRGDPPATSADETLPLRVLANRGKGSVVVQTEYVDYRTDGAAGR